MNDFLIGTIIVQIVTFVMTQYFIKMNNDWNNQYIKNIDYHIKHIQRDLQCLREHYTNQITAHEMLVNKNILPPDRTYCIYNNICYEKNCEDCNMFLTKEEK